MRANRHFLVLLLSALSAAIALQLVAVQASDSSSRIRFTTLSEATYPNLGSNLVRDIVQDLSGYVWIATDRGLDRFDGWESLNFRKRNDSGRLPGVGSLASNHLTAVSSNLRTLGPVWIGTSDAGLIRLDPRTGKSEVISRESPFGEELLSNNIVDLAISEEKFLWIATDRGLNTLDVTTGIIIPANGALAKQPISFVSCLREDEVWVGTQSGELFKWNSSESSFSKVWETSVPVTAIASDADNRIWIATSGKGLFSISGDLKSDPIQARLDAKYVNCLFVDSKFNLWVGTMDGLVQYNHLDSTFTWFQQNPRQRDSLAANQVTSIYEDRSQVLWIATAGGGTSRFSLDREWFTHIRQSSQSADDLPNQTVRALSRGQDESILIGTDRGLAKWDSQFQSFQAVPPIPATIDESITGLLENQDGTLWVTMRGNGILRHNKEGETRHFVHDPDSLYSLPHNNCNLIFQDSSGRILIGTVGHGLYEFLPEPEKFREILPAHDNPGITVLDIAEDETGRVWVATDTNVQILLPGATQMADLNELFPDAAPLASHRVQTILPDLNQIIWFGHADSGLDRFNAYTGQVTNFNTEVHGLSDNTIQSLVKDKRGFLWVATRKGISRLNALQNDFRTFSVEDGLQENGFLHRSAVRGADGNLYFGGLDGFNIIDPRNLPKVQTHPNPFLTGFEYYGEKVVPSPGGILKKEIASSDEITLPYDKKLRFGIGFGNLDYRSPKRGHFRYKLEGHDLDWQHADQTRKASYSGLPFGNYEFLVQSSPDGRTWPDISAKVKIRIPPPWWKTWWFQMSAVVLIISTTVGFTRGVIRSRTTQLRRRQQKLTAQRDRAEAELARQLQNRMLIERAATDLHNELREDQILNDPLEGITQQFGATHCLVHRIGESKEEDQIQLKQIGFYGTAPGNQSMEPPKLEIDHPFVQKILQSPDVYSSQGTAHLPKSFREYFGDHEAVSVLSSKTSFLESANGLVTLIRVGTEKHWEKEEFKLLEALTGQFGIAIAQLDTAATEKKYQKHLEEARHEAEVANRAKSDFLAKMTHELRTPLNAIIGFSEILGEDKTLNPRQRETLDIINNSGEHLLDVINEILDLSKIEAGKVEKNDENFSFVPMLRSVYEMLAMKAESKRIGFHFTAHSEMPGEILTDRSKLRQILINLIGNAIKFTAQGAVSLSVKAVPLSDPTEVDHRLRRRTRIEFEVKDTGRGITENEIPKLFERYSQTESGRRTSEGTGLGLPIAKSFIQLLGGDVTVESVFGEGTTFRFYIECDELAVVTAAEKKLSTSLDETTAQRIVGINSADEEIRILIAEDQPTNRLLLKKILGKAGFALAEAENGQEAVEKWNDWKPHLILMDEDMPVKKGSEATREIKSLADEEDSPVIVSLTAYALEQARTQALEAGCTDFVAKPFRSHELFSVISKHLGIDYVFNDAA